MQPFGAPNMYPPNPYAPPQAPPPKAPIPYALIAFGVVAGMVLMGIAYTLHQKELEEFGPLTAACAGTLVPGTRALQAGQPHRLVGVRMDGSGWTLDLHRVPSAMRASELANTDVVACFGDEITQTIETCSHTTYSRGRSSVRTTPRSYKQLPVRLVAASTGQVLSQTILQGPPPPSCDYRDQRGSPPSSFTFAGASPGSDALLQWLQSPAAMLP